MGSVGSGRDHECSNELVESGAAARSGGLCRIFGSYSHRDEAEGERLDVHLAPLAREGVIDTWCKRVITPASDWERDIESGLAGADLVLLPVSYGFVASPYCFEPKLAEALRRHPDVRVRILPVLVKPLHFAPMPFERF